MIRRQARIGVNDQLAAVIPRQQAQRALQHVADVVGQCGVDDLAEATLREVTVLGWGGGWGQGYLKVRVRGETGTGEGGRGQGTPR